LRYEREAGSFLGSIYINYGVTSALGLAAYFLASLGGGWAGGEVMACLLAFALLFPIFFHRYARSLWLGFDHFIDPPSRSAGRSVRDRR
jgi:hypothetical protein